MATRKPSRRTAAELETLLEFEALISELSSRFVNLAPAEVDHEIEEALRRVCEPLGLDLAVLWQWSVAEPEVIAPTHAWFALPGPKPSEPMRQADYPWTREQILAGRLVVVQSVDALPPAAAVDAETCRRFGIRSVLCLPLAVGGEPPVGALGFNDLRADRPWPPDLVTRLQLVAQVLANALARQRHDLSLKESESRLALAADAAEAGLWTLDLGTGVFWATERARALFGFRQDELLDLARLRSSIHPDDWDRVWQVIERAAQQAGPFEVEYRVVLPGSGGVRWIASRGRSGPETAGARPDRLTGVSIDITERKRVDGALRMGQARLEEATDLAGLAFYEIDFGEESAFADGRFVDLCGIPPEAVQGLSPLEFWIAHLHPDDRGRVLELREEMHAGRVERVNLEYRYQHPARGERWVHHVARVTGRDVGGRVVRTFGVVRDITERRLREEALRQSHAEIERLKDRLQAESDYLRAEMQVTLADSEVTGESPAIRQVLHRVAQVAPTDSSVLVQGETGSGKELVARAIHRSSRRRGRLMVKVNCAALPSGLVESELFGREKGAYTGALTRQAGRFEVADGSTLFLDEVGELPLEAQGKLLRVLETGEFERLGSARTMKVDVRVVAATNRDLIEEVRKGRFREDLYYRLSVFPIRMPPLRERAEDIPQLVWTFLGEFSSRMGKKITQVPRRTMEALQRYPWPGNVRELRNLIEHAAIVTDGDTLTMPRLEESASGARPLPTLAEAERELILRALERAGGHVKGPQGAAAELGLNPATLYSRMKKLGIRPR